jgi:hypothetical protein
MTQGESVQFGRVPYAIVASGAIGRLRPAAAKVYLVICSHSDQDWTAKVGVRRLAELSGYLVGTVSAAIGELRDAGLITVSAAANGQAYTYRLNRSAPAERLSAGEPFSASRTVEDRDRSAPTGQTVQRPLQNRSAPAERNRGTERTEQQQQRRPAAAAVVSALVTWGKLAAGVAAELVDKHRPTRRQALEVIANAAALARAQRDKLPRATPLHNPPGFIITAIRQGNWSPDPLRGELHRRREKRKRPATRSLPQVRQDAQPASDDADWAELSDAAKREAGQAIVADEPNATRRARLAAMKLDHPIMRGLILRRVRRTQGAGDRTPALTLTRDIV